MRLLIVTHYFPEHRGGIEIVAGELARRLTERGIAIYWAASRTPGHDEISQPNLQRIPMRACNFTENRLGFPYPIWTPAGLQRLSRLVAHCDIVHLHDSLYVGNAIACRLAKRYGKPLVVTQHIGAIPYKNPILRGLLQIANRTLARRVMTGADRCVFISPRVRHYFERFVRFRSPSLDWPNGVDTARYRPASDAERREIRSRFGWSDARPVLLFVGRFVEKKGLAILQEAARQLPECDFVFAGWGPLDPRGWGLANVRCLGSLGSAELVPYYQAADLLVLPSVGEGFPLVIQEAAACGTPSLISRETAEGHSDIDGFIDVCDPEPNSVVAQLREILRRSEDRREIAARFARQHWDWEALADRYRDLFEELVTKSAK